MRGVRVASGGENEASMFDLSTTETREKLALVWAERRQRLLAIRVQYDVRRDNGCTLYRLRRIQPVE